MESIKPVRHIDISEFGSENMLVGDINNDGRAEFVFIQGPGSLGIEAFRPDKAVGWKKGHVTPEDLALDCITAMDMDGGVLWQSGAPWRRPYPFRTHGGANATMVSDVAGAGRNELWRIHGNQLETINGETGRIVRTTTLDSDSYYKVFTARFSGGARLQVVVKPIGVGLEGHPHGCPVLALDHDMSPFWTPRDFDGVGHNPLPYDVDGDGRDELLIGWNLVGPDGELRWRLPIEGDADKGHPDRRIVADIDEDGELEQTLAMESQGLVVTDLRGHIKWRKPADHCGGACVGKFFGDRPGLQIMYNDEEAVRKQNHAAMAMVDGRDGSVIWENNEDHYGDVIDWPNQLGPQAMLAWRHEYYDDPKDARPFVMDGNRNIIATFDVPSRLPSPKDFDLPHSHQWRGDWGDYYERQLVDLDGTGPRIVISSRKDIWIFDMPRRSAV